MVTPELPKTVICRMVDEDEARRSAEAAFGPYDANWPIIAKSIPDEVALLAGVPEGGCKLVRLDSTP